MLANISESIQFDDTLAFIKLSKGMIAQIDPEDFDELVQFRWRARKSFCRWYAARRYYYCGKPHWCFMHRQIMHTPVSQIVHHKNRQTMDNRRSNLQNMFQKDHEHLHFAKFPGRLLVQKSSGTLQKNRDKVQPNECKSTIK